jgi:hypothetical protein
MGLGPGIASFARPDAFPVGVLEGVVFEQIPEGDAVFLDFEER